MCTNCQLCSSMFVIVWSDAKPSRPYICMLKHIYGGKQKAMVEIFFL